MIKDILSKVVPGATGTTKKTQVRVSNHGYVRMLDGKSVGIVSKAYWEKYGKINNSVDVKVHMLMRSLGFVELRPAVYEYAGSGKVKDDDVLRDAGFVKLRHDE